MNVVVVPEPVEGRQDMVDWEQELVAAEQEFGVWRRKLGD